MKIFPESEYGSFTLLPGLYPLTSTYFVGWEGLNTYPGLSGTGFAVGKTGDWTGFCEVAVEVDSPFFPEDADCFAGDGLA
jgi:hypothetical protein